MRRTETLKSRQEFALKRSRLTGRYIIMTRKQIPYTLGAWRWTKWEPVRNLEDVAEVMRRLLQKEG